jgi:5-methylcytosine-specific restriction protein A
MGDRPRMFKPRFTTTDRPRVLRTGQNTPRSSCKMGYGRGWQRFRLGYLDDNPICVRCLAGGRVVPATVVDHIVPLSKGGAHMDEANSQSLCKHHHDLKTATEDGGFGRLKRTKERA